VRGRGLSWLLVVLGCRCRAVGRALVRRDMRRVSLG
jgi:hypothetical protein